MAGSPTPDLNLRRRIDVLEREIARLRHELRNQRVPLLRSPVNVKLAKTVIDGTYPSPNANTFKIAFLDCHFSPLEGVQNITSLDRSSATVPYQDFARTINGVWVPPGTMVQVLDTESYSENGGHWWILNTQTEFEAVTVDEITAGTSGTVEIILNGSESGYETEAHYDHVTAAEAVPVGTLVVIRWYADRQDFVLVDHPCIEEAA